MTHRPLEPLSFALPPASYHVLAHTLHSAPSPKHPASPAPRARPFYSLFSSSHSSARAASFLLFYTHTTSSFAERVLVVLRDGRNLVGLLRSFDQFSNVVLEDTYERHFAQGKYGDLALGLYIIRAENLVLLGEMDEAKERMHADVLQQVPVEDVLALKQKDEESEVNPWNFDDA